jgi:hypothetical protein
VLVPAEWSQYAKDLTMTRPEIEAAVIAGPHRMLEVGDLEDTTFFDAKLLGKMVGLVKEFKVGYFVSRRALEDDQYNKINQGAKWLGEAARLTKEYRAAAFLDDAFAGSVYKTFDGLAVLHNAHTLFNSETSATMANTPASTAQVSFSLAGWAALLELAELAKNWNGDPEPLMIDKAIYSPKYIGLAMQIFAQGREPFSGADAQINQVAKRLGNLTQVVSHYKSSVETYFGVSTAKSDFQHLARVGLSIKDTVDEEGTLYVRARERFGFWCPDFHGWFGMNPS